MDALQEIEVIWILFIQGLGDWLREPMRLFTLLGQEEFYMLIMPVLYWSINSVLGLRLAVMLLLSNATNALLKVAIHGPRPYWIDTNVNALVTETSFGAPSGHAQNAASIWGLLAAASRQTWNRVFFIALIVLIGFSRLYLGVHFLRDVLLGWASGGLLLLAYLKAEPHIIRYLKTRTLNQMLGLSLLTSVLLALMVILPVTAASGMVIPEIWQTNALLADAEVQINPLNIEGAFTLAGTWLGIMAGAAWLYHRQGGYNASGTPAQKLLRYVIGVAGIFVLWYLVGNIFPRGEDAISYGLRYVRYTLVGLWISAAAPLLFERLKLSGIHSAQNAPLSTPENTL